MGCSTRNPTNTERNSTMIIIKTGEDHAQAVRAAMLDLINELRDYVIDRLDNSNRIDDLAIEERYGEAGVPDPQEWAASNGFIMTRMLMVLLSKQGVPDNHLVAILGTIANEVDGPGRVPLRMTPLNEGSDE